MPDDLTPDPLTPGEAAGERAAELRAVHDDRSTRWCWSTCPCSTSCSTPAS